MSPLRVPSPFLWCLLPSHSRSAADGARLRLRPEHLIVFWGLLAVGILSIPFSLLTLEGLRWSLIPQFQPARATLFITAVAAIAAAAAGVEAIYRSRYGEAFLWLLVPLVL